MIDGGVIDKNTWKNLEMVDSDCLPQDLGGTASNDLPDVFLSGASVQYS